MNEDHHRNHGDTDGSDDTTNIGFPRRRFMQIAGLAAGAGLLGVGMAGPNETEASYAEFTNRRVQEARKAWAKGFRGQPDRTLAMIGPGLEARHPDLGPWNGVRAVLEEGEVESERQGESSDDSERQGESSGESSDDSERQGESESENEDQNQGENVKLVEENYERLDVSDDIRFFEDSFGPNVGNARNEYPFTGPADVDRVEVHVFAVPPFVTGELRLLLETADGTVIDEFKSRTPHSAVVGEIEPGKDYVIAVETTSDGNPVVPSYELAANYLTDNPDRTVSDPFAGVDPQNVTADTPKVVGWFNEDPGVSETTAKPRGGPRIPPRGTKAYSIMAGSGRASAIDASTVQEDTPDTVLGPGDSVEYEVVADPDRGVYASAFGEHIEVHIHGPEGEHLNEGGALSDSGYNRTNVKVVTPTVHDSGSAPYTIQVVPNNTVNVDGKKRVGRVERVNFGAFRHPDSTAGDRTNEDSLTMHAGVAPNAGLVGLSGYIETRRMMDELVDDFVDLFNLRVLYIDVFYEPSSGVAAGALSNVESIKKIAEAGVLPVSLTDTTPASSPDRETAVADEAIMVVATGPNDGIWSETISEPAAVDEDAGGVYRKPDVTAPGGRATDRFQSAKPGDPFRAEDEQPPIRDYSPSGLAMQAPFVAGTAGLVAQALEEQAPAGIALPEPESTELGDVMRLKQTILATASETPFTAAPWHRREPAYNFGGHDLIEGWGRVNIDAAVEAASRDLTPPCATSADGSSTGGSNSSDVTTSVEESVGLDVPRDSRAVAGHVAGEPGTYRISVTHSEYAGDDSDLAVAPPHIDLFVFDAENPGKHGTPNIVARATTAGGSASLQFKAGRETGEDRAGGTYYVVAKLVNVPGATNTFDIQSHFDLTVEQLEGGSS